MLKNISNLGKALTKADQKRIHGGARPGSGGGCCNPAIHCCTVSYHTNCPGTGNSNCEFLYSTTGPNNPQYPYYNCCI